MSAFPLPSIPWACRSVVAVDLRPTVPCLAGAELTVARRSTATTEEARSQTPFGNAIVSAIPLPPGALAVSDGHHVEIGNGVASVSAFPNSCGGQQARERRKKRNLFASSHRASGFTLFEMVITMVILLLLAAAVFEIITGVLQGASSLQDNLNHQDQVAALSAFLKKKLAELPAQSTLASYQRGTGEGLTQNGIIIGEPSEATVIDAKAQANGYYTLRLAAATSVNAQGQSQDARQALFLAATGDDSTVNWTTLIRDVKTLDWKFQDYNVTLWVDLWDSNAAKPNLVEFSLQLAGDLQPVTMDFWLPKIEPVTVNVQPEPKSP